MRTHFFLSFFILFTLGSNYSSRALAEGHYEEEDYDSSSSIEEENNSDNTETAENKNIFQLKTNTKSILDLSDSELEQVITTTIELQQGNDSQAKNNPSTSRPISSPKSIASRNDNASVKNGRPDRFDSAPPRQTSAISGSVQPWIALLNPLQWFELEKRNSSNASDGERLRARRLPSSLQEKKFESGELRKSSSKDVIYSEPRSLEERIARFFSRFNFALARAKTKTSARIIPIDDSLSRVNLEESELPDFGITQQANVSLPDSVIEDYVANRTGINFVAILGWLGFFFCVMLFYFLRFSFRARVRLGPSRGRSKFSQPSPRLSQDPKKESNALRKTWQQSFPNSETIVSPRNPSKKR